MASPTRTVAQSMKVTDHGRQSCASCEIPPGRELHRAGRNGMSVLGLMMAMAMLLGIPGMTDVGNARAEVKYRITTIEGLGAIGSPEDINNQGQIAGHVTLPGANPRALLYEDGVMTDLGTLGGNLSMGWCLNELGHVAGDGSSTNPPGYHAFLYRDGVMEDLGTLGDGLVSVAGINDADEVVGDVYFETGQNIRPFVYRNGVMSDLNELMNPTENWVLQEALDIDGSGRIVGGGWNGSEWCAYIFEDGVVTGLGTLGGWSSAHAINDRGQIVGSSALQSVEMSARHAFLYENGLMQDLGTLGGRESIAYDINLRGEVVGSSDVDGDMSHAFLYREGILADINDLVDPASGWELYWATAINDKGQIVGWGSQGGFLLTPVPEPGAIVIGITVVLSLGKRRKNRWSRVTSAS